jgi:AraC family transcriptional regulator
MNLHPRIENSSEKKLIGKRIRMSLSNNKTFELWQRFMQRRKEIRNNVNSDLYSIQVYEPSLDLEKFNQDTEFEKWAAIEVNDFDNIPAEMESYILAGGLYAVFIHKGAALTGSETYQYIFKKWLPESEYLLDNRAHFEVLGEKYKNEDPNSEEEIWIPVKTKKLPSGNNCL